MPPPLPPTRGPQGALLAVFRKRQVIDRLGLAYLVLVLVQIATVALYQASLLPTAVTMAGGLSTALLGPAFSLALSLHIFAHRQPSRGWEIAAVALTYLVTLTSFAILYVIIDDTHPVAFGQPAGSPSPLSLGAALYFSLVTITTTGYGDILPLSGLARLAAGGEILIGLSYQVFVFSLVAALISANPPSTRE